MEEEKIALRDISVKLNFSHEEIRKKAIEIGYKYLTCTIIPQLTALHKQERFIYCSEYKDNDLTSTVFSDESYVQLFRNTTGQ